MTFINTLSVPCRSLNSINLTWIRQQYTIPSMLNQVWAQDGKLFLTSSPPQKWAQEHIWSSIKLNGQKNGQKMDMHEPAAKRQADRMCVQKLWINVSCHNDNVWHQHLEPHTHSATGTVNPQFRFPKSLSLSLKISGQWKDNQKFLSALNPHQLRQTGNSQEDISQFKWHCRF